MIAAWYQKRKQCDALRLVFLQLHAPLPQIPQGRQYFDSDPIWCITNFTYNHYYPRGELNDFLKRLIISSFSLPDVRLPITSFFGSNSGKSAARDSLRDFALEVLLPRTEGRAIGFSSSEDWEANTTSYLNRFRSCWPQAYYFRWSRKLYLINSDQSHHFAAIYRQAIEQQREWYVPCNLQIFELADTVFCSRTSGEIFFFAAGEVRDGWERLHAANLHIETVQVGRDAFFLNAYRIRGLTPDVYDFASQEIELLEKNRSVIRFERIKNLLPI